MAARTRLLFADNPEPMWVIDRATLQFLEVNGAAVEKYGYPREDFLSLRLLDLAVDDGRRLEELISKHPQKAADFCDMRLRLKDGSVIDAELHMHRIRYHGKNAILVVPHDCTRRKQLEEQLRQAQKMEAVGMLAGGIAHDFNNLLTIINGYSQLLLATLPESDSNHSAVEQIMKAGERAAELTRQLLTFSRRQVLRPKVLDLNAVVTGMGSMLRRLIGEHIELHIVVGPDLGRVHADPGQIEQVVLNLAVNARDAMPEGGTLIVETANTELDQTYTGAHVAVKPGPYVMLAVTDTGTGMDAETRSHLFEPFFTTKGQGKGTGLGLSTVYGIIKQSGGNLGVYSEPGQGTCVKVYLPRVDQPVALDSEKSPELAKQGSETILVVEDEEAVRRLISETLQRNGYRVLVAASGREALAITGSHPNAIQLVITDVVMPQMSGRELAGKLKAQRPDIQVLFISGYTDQAITRNGGLESGANFLQKPFTPATLMRKVREILDASGISQKHGSVA